MSSAANKIAIMLEMQHAMNTKVHEQWFECAEMLEYL